MDAQHIIRFPHDSSLNNIRISSVLHEIVAVSTTIASILCFFFATPLCAKEVTPQETQQEFQSVEERRLYSAIREEREQILAEREGIELKKKELKSLEQDVDKKLTELENKLNELKVLRKKIETLLADKAEFEIQNTQDLAKIYEKMDPQRAAMAIMELEPKLATRLLGSMKAKAAAKVLDNIPQPKASELSKRFSLLQLE